MRSLWQAQGWASSADTVVALRNLLNTLNCSRHLEMLIIKLAKVRVDTQKHVGRDVCRLCYFYRMQHKARLTLYKLTYIVHISLFRLFLMLHTGAYF